MNSNGYVPFHINSLDTIVSGGKYADEIGKHSVEAAWRGCREAQYSHQEADLLRAYGGSLPSLKFTSEGLGLSPRAWGTPL